MSETFTYNPVPEGSKPEPKKKKSPQFRLADPGNTAKDTGGNKRKGGEFLEKKVRKFNVIPSNGG